VCLANVARADDAPRPASPAADAAPTTPPPGVAGKQRLSDEDFARKKEGYYFTGLPLVSYDPSYGIGGGGRVYFYFDGSRSDPLFAYTPYLHRVYGQFFLSSGGEQAHVIDYDGPAFPDSNYRVRATLEYDSATDWSYFGIGARTMRPLAFPGAPGATFAKMSDYVTAQNAIQPDGTTYARYNTYNLQRGVLQLALERNMLGGILRSMVGANISYASAHDYTGEPTATSAKDAAGHTIDAPEATTLLAADCKANRVIGCGGGWDNVLRLALSVDTRDFEPDPNSGIYAELSGEFGTPLLGSQYQYMRLMASLRAFYSPIPRLTDLVLAARGTYEVETHGTPLFTATLMPYIDDNHAGLGGFRTLRGYRQNRFVGPVMVVTNYEVRWTFLKFHVLSQGFGLIAVPFLDMGAVFDDVRKTSFSGWARSQGMGLRIAWNEATILMLDYGVSEEDSGLYLNFNHIF
jgi:hypothetical protein